jgi:hypothetical protein
MRFEGEDDAAEEIYSGRFRVSLGKPGPLICKEPFMGLYKLKGLIKLQTLSSHLEERRNSGKSKEVYRYSRKISCEEEILESITG